VAVATTGPASSQAVVATPVAASASLVVG